MKVQAFNKPRNISTYKEVMKINGIPKYYRTSDLCANCWGTQEYAGVIKRFRYDRKTDFNNQLKKRSFIEELVYKYLP